MPPRVPWISLWQTSRLRSFYRPRSIPRRLIYTTTETVTRPPIPERIPSICPGCGALSHTNTPVSAGYYSESRKAVKRYLQQQDETPVCDRCHDLVFNNRGASIAHPSVQDLVDSISESSFKRNHVYHVLDAADFPMSLISNIFQTFELAKPRSQNRRSQNKFSTKPTISFIITRSDLLGPTKEIVDKTMPYFQATLRSALGRQGKAMRLGNIHLVSAKRGWWTKELKDEIWQRGGANWMIGKANVGKSNLFPVLFPKVSIERTPIYADLEASAASESNKFLEESSLLPPPQPEKPFPAMPIVSSLPGTTASPIRLPFGGGKGELIDMPGLDRGSLELHVQPNHKLDLIMQHRPNVKQNVIRSGQSLFIGGGLIRITPFLDANTTMLAYSFVPVDGHVTATDKATVIQANATGVKTILASESATAISTAGTFSLTTDVTRIRAGPLLRAGVPLHRLPFQIYSTDILIEGMGWIELVCQVRKPRSDQTSGDSGQTFPSVEVFSPGGNHIAQREPLGAWMMWDRKPRSDKARPRKSMKGAKQKI